MLGDSFLKSDRSLFRAAIVLAIVADAVQILIFPLFAEGAISPLDDILDLTVMVALIQLIGWHWEFLPSRAYRNLAEIIRRPLYKFSKPASSVTSGKGSRSRETVSPVTSSFWHQLRVEDAVKASR